MAPDADCLGDLILAEVDDEVFVALADRRRRIALYYLRWRRRASIEELADVVAGWQGAVEQGAVSRADRDRVLAALHHRHLAILADAGLVEVDREAETVAIRSLAEPVRSLIDFAYDAEGGEGGTDTRS